jgi:methylenetetrahydrofolate--tRNA-(uracil-5-)-methyltransferase
MVTEKITNHKNIRVIREEIKKIPETTTIIATGPLTSPAFSKTIQKFSGQNNLFFFDAIAPIIEYNSINMKTAFLSSRYHRGEQDEGDYINCPLNKEEYFLFVNELKNAKIITQKDFEKGTSSRFKSGRNLYFEACLPIEVIASRGVDALAYGPMRPVGIHNPHNDLHPYAVVQLRQDNIAGSLFNMVGFQTNLAYAEQERVFRMIPGLEQAFFMRFGQMHRNTFICSPNIIRTTLQTIKREDLFFAGQISGIEGYLGNIASGVVAGINAYKYLHGESLISFPSDTLIGALCHYISHADSDNFQPMKANLGLLPPLEITITSRRQRAKEHAQHSLASLEHFICENHIL